MKKYLHESEIYFPKGHRFIVLLERLSDHDDDNNEMVSKQ